MSPFFGKYAPLSLILVLVALVATSTGEINTVDAAPATPLQRLMIESKSATDHSALRADLQRAGVSIVVDRPEIGMMVITTKGASALSYRSQLVQNSHVAAVASDRIERLVPAASTAKLNRTALNAGSLSKQSGSPKFPVIADPSFTLPGLMWNVDRIGAPAAWVLGNGTGLGLQSIKVAVEDTGLDYNHIDLVHKVDKVIDFTVNEQPNICSTVNHLPTDAQLAIAFGTTSDEDFNGHGTFIGGAIAASINVTGTNGIAPRVQLVSLKIAQNCGAAYDSTIIDGFIYAANNGIDLLNISFASYLDRSDPAQDLIYRFYKRAVNYALAHGTLIIAEAGNDHARIGAGGKVVSHGALAPAPGGVDLFGLYEVPGGIPGVIDVSSTNNIVNAPSASCPADSLVAGTHQWCKLTTDAHQPFGAGKMNQLAYYSNYGPRIDLAGPGGARKFNLPSLDRGGCEGWPWCGNISVEGGTSAADGYNAWQTFSITSAFATEVPCFTFLGDPNFPANQCYGVQEGTDSAAPAVSGAAAIAISLHPEAWKDPPAIIKLLKNGAVHFVVGFNKTPGLSASDHSAGDLGGATCPGGWCHLGGSPISNSDAYGNGLVNAFGSGSLP